MLLSFGDLEERMQLMWHDHGPTSFGAAFVLGKIMVNH
jgi:hypothetical protein